MKHLIFTLWFVLFLSSISLAGVEYVTEEVCPALAGCWMNVETGECPDCVMERREVAHTHEEEVDYVPKGLGLIEVEIPVKKKVVKGCTVLVAGKPRPCDWAEGDNKRAVVIKRANKECGGFYKWKWTSREMKEYVCKYKG